MSHEKSITFQDDNGNWVNIATVHQGKTMTERKARAMYNQGIIKALGGRTYKTEPEASAAARKRSEEFGMPRLNPRRRR